MPLLIGCHVVDYTMFFGEVKGREGKGREEGRTEGRKDGRKEGRKEGGVAPLLKSTI